MLFKARISTLAASPIPLERQHVFMTQHRKVSTAVIQEYINDPPERKAIILIQQVAIAVKTAASFHPGYK